MHTHKEIVVDLQQSLEAETNFTTKSLSDMLSAQEEALSELEKEMDDVKMAKTGDLAELQAQIEIMMQTLEEKKQALMTELEEKKAELEKTKESLEGQIYMLDSQIYAIRCYMGEVVNFTKIRTGKNAPNDEPIVIHQKLRFLDEDLGKLASLYEIQWNEINMFEEFLRHHPLALETFAPNKRCVMLVRLSRNAIQMGTSKGFPYLNILESYEYYHGKTVGIIIRNGDNVFLGWTDEKRVHIDDDLLLSEPITVSTGSYHDKEFISDWEREKYIKEQKEIRKKILDGCISRAFVYNILQGIVDNSTILPLPKGVTLSKESSYVIYSIADKWLGDDRFGSFTDIIERCNKKVTKGDPLLTVQNLRAERNGSWDNRYYSRTWENTRGIGDKNRTHDALVEDCKIYKANVVEYGAPRAMIRYKFPKRKLFGKETVEYMECTCHADRKLSDDCIILEHFEHIERHVFVSAEKTDSYMYEGKDPRANFEIYPEEFINLQYMNSVWLEWVITNKKLGDWKVGGGKVDYAYGIRYLNFAMHYIKKREAKEKELIDDIDINICKDKDWPLMLSEWKLDAGVREITKFQAKRFVRYIHENGK